MEEHCNLRFFVKGFLMNLTRIWWIHQWKKWKHASFTSS